MQPKPLTALRMGQVVEFISGPFQGRIGVIQVPAETRSLIKISGTVPGPNGKRVKAGSTFAPRSEFKTLEN